MFGRKKKIEEVRSAPVVPPSPEQVFGDTMQDQAQASSEVVVDSGAKPLGHERDDQGNNEQANLALQSRLRASIFAEITSLFMQSPRHRQMFIADLDWLVLPAFVADQFTIARASSQDGSTSAAVGVALWARVSAEVDSRLSTNPDQAIRLTPEEWTSGENLWLVDIVANPQVGQALVDHLRKTSFAGQSFKLRAKDEAGNNKVVTLDPEHNSMN